MKRRERDRQDAVLVRISEGKKERERNATNRTPPGPAGCYECFGGMCCFVLHSYSEDSCSVFLSNVDNHIPDSKVFRAEKSAVSVCVFEVNEEDCTLFNVTVFQNKFSSSFFCG